MRPKPNLRRRCLRRAAVRARSGRRLLRLRWAGLRRRTGLRWPARGTDLSALREQIHCQRSESIRPASSIVSRKLDDLEAAATAFISRKAHDGILQIVSIVPLTAGEIIWHCCTVHA